MTQVTFLRFEEVQSVQEGAVGCSVVSLPCLSQNLAPNQIATDSGEC